MRAIICDKCGKTQEDTHHCTTAEVNREYYGTPSEIHLCSDCTEKFLKWVSGEETNHDTYPRISF